MPTIVSKRIGIDCRLSGSTHAGIGRYIEELILRLPVLAPENEWVFFFYDQWQVDEYWQKLGKKLANVKIVIAPIKHYSFAEQRDLPKIFGQEKLDLLHVPHFNVPIFYQGKLVVTIHDLLWHEFIGLQVTTLSPHIYLLKYLAYRLITKFAIDKSSAILVPARTIKKIVEKYYPAAADKIKVTTEGFSLSFAKRLPTLPIEKTLLYVGSLYPHKNLKLVLQALSLLPEYKLKIVGSRNVFQDQAREAVAHHGVQNQVMFTGFLNDEDLRSEMAVATALVQPSLSEGFGLTGVEAMIAGLPVLASDIPIFREIYATGAKFFNPNDPVDFAKTVKGMEQINRQQLIANGQEVAKLYSWDAMSEKTLKVYNSI